MSIADAPARAIVRIVLIIVAVVVCLYLIYLLRRPISWLFIAMFIAVALSKPVNFLDRHMKRGFAIGLVYLGLLGVIVAIAALFVPPVVNGGNNLADDAPSYVQDIQDYVQKNKRLRKINEDYQITDKLSQEADKLPSKLGGAAGVLRDIGFGIVNGIFATVTILVLAAFMLSGGRGWIESRACDAATRARGANRAGAGAHGGGGQRLRRRGVADRSDRRHVDLHRADDPERAFRRSAGADGGPLLTGAAGRSHDRGGPDRSGDAVRGLPRRHDLWVIWAIVYQQLENQLIQPQVQKRTVNVNGFIVLVSVLFGATLLGVLGAIVAIPIAASIQIVLKEYWDYRRENELLLKPPPTGPASPEPA